MLNGIARWLCLVLAGGLVAGCGGSSSSGASSPPPPPPPPAAETRSFYLGFTPWPYDATQMAVDDTNQRIQDNGDIVAHHLTTGVPWEEAFTGQAYHPNVEAELTGRVQMLQPGKQVYLAIDSLNGLRDSMARNWGENFSEPRPAPWDMRTFADTEVATAYVNFALDLIDRFDPLYFNYGTEISELMLNDPAAFDDYVLFAERVYDGIKAVHPDLPLMVSIAAKSPGTAEMATIASEFARIRSYVDIVGVSIYPYAFFEHADRGDPASLPADWLSQISSLADGRPLAVTETGWIAEDMVIPEFGADVASNAAFQDAYVARVLSEADQLGMPFVIWFAHVDFDAFWNGALMQDPLALIWRDTGLVDENLVPRPALGEWQAWLSRERR